MEDVLDQESKSKSKEKTMGRTEGGDPKDLILGAIGNGRETPQTAKAAVASARRRGTSRVNGGEITSPSLSADGDSEFLEAMQIKQKHFC